MAGFETGDTLAYGSDVAVGSGISVAIVSTTPTARSGTYCFKAIGAQVGSASQQWAFRAAKVWAHAATTELWYAFGFFAHHVAEFTAPAQTLFVARDASNNVNILLSLDSGVIRAYVATAGGASPAGANLTLIGAASASLAMDTWHLIEVHLVASTTTTGTCEVFQDGTQVVSVTSTRTAQTSASYASFDVAWVNSSNAQLIMTGNPYHAFDDVRINDTNGTLNNGRPGDGKIVALLPNGVGTTIGGTPLTGNPSSTNWQNVDELPPSVTDYNSGTTIGTGETYALTDPAAGLTAQAVNVIAQGFNTDGGGGNLGITTKTPAGTSEGSAQPLTVTPRYMQRLLEVDPSDAGAWSNAKLAALEAGATLR
jgi:hypothetical protein